MTPQHAVTSDPSCMQVRESWVIRTPDENESWDHSAQIEIPVRLLSENAALRHVYTNHTNKNVLL